jgi:hypothetical protein
MTEKPGEFLVAKAYILVYKRIAPLELTLPSAGLYSGTAVDFLPT